MLGWMLFIVVMEPRSVVSKIDLFICSSRFCLGIGWSIMEGGRIELDALSNVCFGGVGFISI